jgi:protein-S-isoprenylcysteine O-methyltransferase Ste14
VTTRTEALTSLLRNLPLPAGQVVGLVTGVLLDRLRVAPLPGPRIAHRSAGVALILAGCVLNGWALNERRRRETDGFDLERPGTLVTTGPYALTRHPMYVGWWCIHGGIGVFRGSAWMLATLTAAVLAERRTVTEEERTLTRVFGDQYTRYTRSVPRYLRFASDRSRRAAASSSEPRGGRRRSP